MILISGVVLKIRFVCFRFGLNVFKSSVDCDEGEEEDESEDAGDESGRLDDDGVTHEPEDETDIGRFGFILLKFSWS